MRFLLGRLAFYPVTAWAALTIKFLLPHLMPGSPLQAALDKLQGTVSPGAVKALAAQFAIDTRAGLWSRYGSYPAPEHGKEPTH